MRAIQQIHTDTPSHWVGDGFYVKTIVSHFDNNPDFNYSHTDPFLMLDYGAPKTFLPNPRFDTHPFGVGQHPHKGFETVTIAYSGAISHSDSAGGCGDILEGDVQWMTAGRGIMHEEFHSKDFGKNGGIFSMVQLWVNLPSADKLTPPKYQTLKRSELPIVDLINENIANDGEHLPIGKVAVIAGSCYRTVGVTNTFSPINMWDIELQLTGSTVLEVPNNHNVLLLVQQGVIRVNDTEVSAGQLVQFTAPTQDLTETQMDQITQTVDSIKLTYDHDANAQIVSNTNDYPAKLLLLSGEPIGEPIASYGPFVMNTQEELKQTFRDYQTGNFV